MNSRSNQPDDNDVLRATQRLQAFSGLRGYPFNVRALLISSKAFVRIVRFKHPRIRKDVPPIARTAHG